MVVYICDVCKKKFGKKFEYDSHVNKIKKCSPNGNGMHINDFNCEICKVSFSRTDALKRHYETKKHEANKKINKEVNINNNSNNQIKHNNITGNVTVGNNNKNINNYYLISPFAQEEINKLTIIEKMSTLLSQENPIIEIILITNLNPNKPEYHNIGYTDLKSGYGIIFNGKTWERKEINVIINELLAAKKNDLFKIKLEINQYLSEEHKKIIEEKLQNVKDNVEPRLEHHTRSKGKLMTNLKTHFYNGRTIIQDAVTKSGAPIEGIRNENKNSWMDEYNFGEIEKQIRLVNVKKEMAKKLAKETNYFDYATIIKLIDEVSNIQEINIINRLLIKSLTKKIDINKKIINKEIEEEKYIDEIIFDKN
jgi:hypothetical protein